MRGNVPEYKTPGVSKGEDVITKPAAAFRTGVPVFLGLIKKTDLEALSAQYSLVGLPGLGLWLVRLVKPGLSLLRDTREIGRVAGGGSFFLWRDLPSGEKPGEIKVDTGPQPFTLWADFENVFKGQFPPGYLAYAVRGFFENKGPLCYVQIVCYEDQPLEALRAGLTALQAFAEFDLVCAPDIMWPRGAEHKADKVEVQRMQLAVLEHCERQGDCFAILDAWPGLDDQEIPEQRKGLAVSNAALANGALYYPWVRVADQPGLPGRFVPPCGHIAGVFARSDLRVGVRKAPANEVLEGVLDLEVNLTAKQQEPLNEQGINCLRSFPGRGIRIWGARTLSHALFWRYINVRRLYLTAARWIERNMADVVFEPQSPQLWAHIVRDLTAYFEDLHRLGALAGRTPEESFYVKCDAELNPPEIQAAGMVITEIGLAPTIPAEFIVVRLVYGPAGLTMVGPAPANHQ